MAPLRALANEFYLRSCKTIQGVYCPTTANEVRPLANKSLNFKLLIITPELCSESIIENHKENIQIVIDEFHLFYYWGDSFRPKLLELYEQVCSRELPLLLLSATIDEEIEKRWECEASLNYQNSFKINLGNQQIKKDPQKVIYFPLKRFKKLQLDYAKLKRGSHATLIFCKYRKEVERLALDFEKNGKKVLTCIGGETHLFHFKLAKCQKPDFIIATSALSHGVNLPLISEIYLTYPIENYDFWIQMVGRAGRRGEEFKVFTMNPFCLKNKH